MVSVVLGFICMRTSFFFGCYNSATLAKLTACCPWSSLGLLPTQGLLKIYIMFAFPHSWSVYLVTDNSLAHCVQEAWVFCCSVLSNSWMNPFWSWHIVEHINCNKLIKIFHDKTLFAVWRDSFKMETPHKNHIVNADASVHLVLCLIYSPSMVIIFWPCSLSGRLPGCAVFEELWHSCQAAPQSFFGLIMVLL